LLFALQKVDPTGLIVSAAMVWQPLWSTASFLSVRHRALLRSIGATERHPVTDTMGGLSCKAEQRPGHDEFEYNGLVLHRNLVVEGPATEGTVLRVRHRMVTKSDPLEKH
jgi:hypothetical protein